MYRWAAGLIVLVSNSRALSIGRWVAVCLEAPSRYQVLSYSRGTTIVFFWITDLRVLWGLNYDLTQRYCRYVGVADPWDLHCNQVGNK